MNTIHIREHTHDNGVNRFLESPECFNIVWENSLLEESSEFDELNQCMIEKRRHFYQIIGIEEIFDISFYSEKFYTREKFIKNIEYSLMHNLVYEYNEETKRYERHGY